MDLLTPFTYNFLHAQRLVFVFFPHNKLVENTLKRKGLIYVKGKFLVGAIAVGAVLGSAAAVAIAPCCTSSHNRRKLMKYKNQMFKTVGSVLDAVADFRR